MTLDQFYKICDSIVLDEYGCHQWPRATVIGYYWEVRITDPKIRFMGVRSRVHRLALERKLKRQIKPGFQALHICDCPSCLNPDHLYEGTPADNVRDIMERNPEVFKNRKRKYKSENFLKVFWDRYDNDPEFQNKIHEAFSKRGKVLMEKPRFPVAAYSDRATMSTPLDGRAQSPV
jgi:hypothetical protein